MVRPRSKKPRDHPDDQRIVYTVAIVDPQDQKNYRATVAVDMQKFARLVAALVYGDLPAQIDDRPGPMEAEFARGALRVTVKQTRGIARGDVTVRVRTYEVSEGSDGEATEE